ncbi:HAMP domain-containing histidine kinase [Aliifodinibius sp. S!AR15-10]|uniref:sensor histidine kinase n=1 Tax=Aliifodinibius sp. S!AR15-10 TaxID=2950437 RepID=UPI0028660CDF|nr:HAMP domain-containing sensor histidine kinase [Aliifodinibius sp. S!AR15-10]MDR8392256.1 HAMP domain-containing histidine kinase [Aliifodinibius sp. S!AR15-10]
MKLVNKFLLIYLLVTIIVLSAGGIISYYLIKDEIDTELRWRYMDRIDRIGYLIEEGRDFGFDSTQTIEKFQDRNLIIRELEGQVNERVIATDTMAWHPHLRRMEHNVKVSAYRQINDRSYYISTWGAIVESDDIIEAVVKTLLWILGLQVVGALGVGFLVSGRLFKPFRETLEKIRDFKLNQREPIKAEKTSVKEFDELNRFVDEMTTKAVKDYQNLKEFAENASHELQTPLSIAQGKLELLTETELKPEQFQYVESAQAAIRKLSKLSESLGLLTKIENHEFSNSQQVNFTNLIKDSLSTFDELITLNGLRVEANLQDDVQVQMHPVLADILWTNLLQNAIKHNVAEGYIDISLDSEKLVIANKGKALKIDPNDLFKRFKKADQSTSSIGLGLSIVRRIVNQSDLEISYSYEESDRQHTVQIDFANNAHSE